MGVAIETLRDIQTAGNRLASAEAAEELRGSYRGERIVSDPDLSSQLEDLVEEIGMAIAYRGNPRSPERRRFRHRREEVDNAPIEAYRHSLPDLPETNALMRLIDGLRSLETLVEDTPFGEDAYSMHDAITMELEAYDPDVTHQYAGLKLALMHLDQGGVSEQFRSILQNVEIFFEDGSLGRNVRAGYAASLPAAKAAIAFGADSATIRNTYRLMIAEARNAAELFKLLRQFDLSRSFKRVVATFSKAAARDLASTGPSTDRNYIRSLIIELHRLSKANSVVLMAADLMRTTNRHLVDGDKPAGDELDVAANVLTFACLYTPVFQDARALMQTYDKSPLAAQLVFANGLRELHGELPLGIAPTPQAHLYQRTVILQLLSSLVEDEENAFQNSSF